MMFLLKCPRCSHDMKYATRSATIIGRKKKCVYCNFSMDVRKCVVQELL